MRMMYIFLKIYFYIEQREQGKKPSVLFDRLWTKRLFVQIPFPALGFKVKGQEESLLA